MKLAVGIKEKIEALESDLAKLLDMELPVSLSLTVKRRSMSAAARAKIGAAQKKRWAKQKRNSDDAPFKRRRMSAASKAKIAAAAKARWAKAKAAGKTRL